MRAVILLLILGTGCAAAAPAPRAEVAPGVHAEERPPEFERLVSSFRLRADGAVYLTPRLAEEDLTDCGAREELARIADQLERLGSPRAEAQARLNLGALLWCDGEADEAYRALARAQALFLVAQDMHGVARAHEWLGFLFWRSHRKELAEEHLAAAYQVFARLGDGPGQARVLGYAED